MHHASQARVKEHRSDDYQYQKKISNPQIPDASRPHISTSGQDEVGWQLLLHLVAAEQLNAELKSCHRVDDIKSLEHVWMYDSKLAAGLVVHVHGSMPPWKEGRRITLLPTVCSCCRLIAHPSICCACNTLQQSGRCTPEYTLGCCDTVHVAVLLQAGSILTHLQAAPIMVHTCFRLCQPRCMLHASGR